MSHLGFADAYGSSSPAVDALFTKQSDGTMSRDLGDFLVVRVDDEKPGRFLKEVINVIMHGECGSTTTAPDPLLDWVYEGRTEEVFAPLPRRPSSDRLEWFRWIATYLVHFAINRKSLYALVDKESNQVVSASACGPPRSVAYDRSLDEMGINIRKAGMATAIEFFNNPRLKSLGSWQHSRLPPSGGNFFYIVIFATAPEWQGRGCGSALLRFLGEVADADGVESFLETAGERNTSFYSKKGGFEVVVREPIGNFNHEGGAVSMRRPANSNAQNRNSGRRNNNDSQAASSNSVYDDSLPPPREASPSSGYNPPPREASPSSGYNPPPPPPASSSSSSGCDRFSPKQRSGPLASYCQICGGHLSKHE